MFKTLRNAIIILAISFTFQELLDIQDKNYQAWSNQTATNIAKLISNRI